jgi:HAD superfamily hydrolase (TIGR01549 family)
MKIYYLPPAIKALIFDIDLTLYDNKAYYESQKALLIRELAQSKGQTIENMQKQVEKAINQFKQKTGGKITSMGNIFRQFGISIKQNCKWRDKLFQPEDFLKHDQALVNTFEKLSKDYKICAVTNNTQLIARRTLRTIGILDFFNFIIALDHTFVSKPHIKPFSRAAQRLNLPFNQLISIGDRYDVDLAIPLKQGMGAILVQSLADIYRLPEELKNKKNNHRGA